MRIGIGVGPGLDCPITENQPIDALIARFVAAEAEGFASAWIGNIFSNDATVLLALAGRETSRIELAPFVIPTYPRHPFAMAQAALTANVACGGRFTLGIGLSHRMVIEGMFGLDFSKPIRHMREYLTVLEALLSGDEVNFDGDEYRVHGRLTVPGAAKPQVLVAALGPQMLRLTGRLADGTATWLGGPRYLAEVAVPNINAGAKEAGRPTPRIVASLPIVVTHCRDEALAAVAERFIQYTRIPSYRAVLDTQDAPDAAAVAIVGDETEVERQLREIAALGVSDFNAITALTIPEDPDAIPRTRAFLASLRV